MNVNAVKSISNEILNTRRMLVSDLLEHPFSKVALSLGELFHGTSKKSVRYAKGCTATLQKAMPKRGRWNFSIKCDEKWSKGPHRVRVKLLKKGQHTKGLLGREIEISCDCNAWRYNGADYNAQKKDYSERQISNGAAPSVRDPKHKYLICKHVATCVPILKDFLIPADFK